MSWHALFDLLAFAAAALARLATRRLWPAAPPLVRQPAYLACLTLGAAAGAYGFGTANLLIAGEARLGRSVLGALIGGGAAVEAFKAAARLRTPTGAVWALPFVVGVAVGRIGCHLSGLDDATFGVPVASGLAATWAVDHGDGVPRHPVALYESLTMCGLALVMLRALVTGQGWPRRRGFAVIVLVYAAQRLVWEAFKPFPPWLGPLSFMQVACCVLALYGWWLWRRGDPATWPHGADRQPASS